MAFQRFNLDYITDEGEQVVIQKVYFDDVGIDPDTRLDLGRFDDPVDCAIITKRRNLKPRKVFIRIEDNEGNTKDLEVVVKTKEDYQDLIDNPESPSTGRVVRYEGEQSPICYADND